MDIITNYLMISGAVLLNILVCLCMFFSGFKAWMWMSGQIRSMSEMTNLRIELLTRKIGELEKKHGAA
jgi:hypothetical protein